MMRILFQLGGKSCPRRLKENAAGLIRKQINKKKIVEAEVQLRRLNAKLTADKPDAQLVCRPLA